MKHVLAAFLALAPALGLAEASTWTMDPMHTHASFTVRHLVISNVRGDFKKLSGTVKMDEKDFTKSSVEVAIETASIDTRIAKRDEDLRSENFFDAAKYPTITFKSTKIAKAGKDRLEVTGDLTMHGVTKPVTLDVDALVRWREEAPHGDRAAPTPEHLDPLFVSLGARLEGDRVQALHGEIRHGNLGMRSFALRSPPASAPAQ